MQTRFEVSRKNPEVLIKQLLCSHYVIVKPFHSVTKAAELFIYLFIYVLMFTSYFLNPFM